MATENFHPIGKWKVVSFCAENYARDLSSESISIKVGESLCLCSPQPVSTWFPVSVPVYSISKSIVELLYLIRSQMAAEPPQHNHLNGFIIES